MGIRTPDLLNAIEALYQLSYDPDYPIFLVLNYSSDGDCLRRSSKGLTYTDLSAELNINL